MNRLGALLKRPFFIASVYAFVSWIWISVSDTLLHQANLSRRVAGMIDTAKGSVFVAVTAILMYSLLRIATRELAHASRAEDARTESEQRFRVLADSAPVLVWMSDVDAKCDYFNTEWLRFTGRGLERELESGWTEGIHREDVQGYLDAYRDAFSARRALTAEFRLRRHDGQYRWVLNNGVPRFTETGAFAGFIWSCVDISDQKEAAAALSSANEMLLGWTQSATSRLAAIVEGSEDAIIGYTLDGVVTDWNQAATRLYGYSADESIGRSASHLAPPNNLNEIREIVETIAAGGRIRQREGLRQRKDGSLVDVSYSSFPISGPAGSIVGGATILHDITQRKQTIETLRKSEERFQLAAKATKDVIWDLDIQSGSRWWSDSYWKLYGHSPGTKETESEAWKDRIHPEDRDRVWNAFQSALLQRIESSQVEYRIRRVDNSYSVVLGSAYITYDESGLPIRAVGAITDLSEGRELEAQFRQAQKMEAVGRLAGGIAHDFNNFLLVITSYAEMMREQLNPEDRFHRNLEQMLKAAERAASLTHQLLAFSRQQVLAPRIIDLNSVVEDSLKLIRRLIGEDIRINVSLGAPFWAVKADPGQIVQVLMNLCVNARDAMPNGGELTIETSNISFDAGAANISPALLPGKYAALILRDTGTGMTKEVQYRLFEPFFTTKDSGKGTGLGLSTVFGIIKQSGGYIWVDSELGRGSSFTIYLPAVDAPLTTVVIPEITDADGHGEVILLVDDENALRGPISDYLSMHGYYVLAASDGAQALQIAKQHRDSIQLLFTDVVLPKLSGVELAREVTRICPKVVTLFMSGYTDREVTDYDPTNSKIGFLQKPFALQTLMQKLREMITAKE